MSSLVLVLAIAVALGFGVLVSQMIFTAIFATFRLHRRMLSAPATAVQPTTAKVA
jgi:hypothetical protein